MKKPGQPNWGQQLQQQQQQRMRQQQQRRAAGYVWQKQRRERKLKAQRLQAQQGQGRLGQPQAGLDWQEGAQYAARPQQRSCLGRLVRTVGILLAIGACLLIVAVVLGNI